MKKKVINNKKIYFLIITFSLLSIFAIGVLAFQGAFYPKDKFYKNTKINGVDVSGLNISEATNVLQTQFNSTYKDISVSFKYKTKEWNYTADDFEVVDDFSQIVSTAFNTNTSSNFFDRKIKMKQLEKNNGNIEISYRNMLGGFDEKINTVCNEIYQELIEPSINFQANNQNPFSYNEGQSEISVDRPEFEMLIDNAFKESKKIVVYVPYIERKPTKNMEELQKLTKLRSNFSTNYSKSSKNRKNNVATALKAFNGLIVQPEEEISFNSTTGARTKENGYKPANIILNGVYVEGSGGGVCQASTTLYNALLLANLEILEVSKHSLPASYVPLALDAMVSEGVSDLKFKNNTTSPIYIKTWSDESNVHVQIFGIEHENGDYFKTKSEFIKAIPHSGDRIISDTNGEYSNKVTFKGEYLRLKYPQEGYEAKAYLQRFSKDGVLLEEIEIRHETYQPQEGIIIEGTEDLYEGITLPENKVKFIPPQSTSNTNKNNVSNKISGSNSEKYNP